MRKGYLLTCRLYKLIDNLLTFQFGTLRGARLLIGEALDVIVDQPLACQYLVEVQVVVLGGVRLLRDRRYYACAENQKH